MKVSNQRPSVLRFVAVGLAAVATVAACTTREGPQGERTGTTSSALFANGGFETGAANAPPVSWTVQPYLNPNPGGVTIQTPETRAGLNLATGGKPLTDTIAAVNQADPDLGAGASLRVCRYGNQCARVNFHSSTTYGNGENVNSLLQTMTVGAGDVDPSDGKVHVRFVVAPVLQNPAHAVNEQPYYMVQLTDLTTGTLLYSDFNLSAQPGVPWKTVNGGTANEIDYTDWSLVDITPTGNSLAMGDMVKLEVIAGGCSLGGHFGEIYLDGLGPTVPGLFVTGTGPAQANAGTSVTYALSYHNGGGSAETGVVIDFTTPPNTTYQSISPPAGATCVTPAVGAAGTVTCTFSGSVAAGASGSFTIMVAINAGTTGSITAGTYDIQSAQETALLGNRDHHDGRLHARRSVLCGRLVRRESRRLHADPRQRDVRPDGCASHEPDAQWHVHRRGGGLGLRERRMRHARQQVWICEFRRALHGGQRYGRLPERRLRSRQQVRLCER